MKLYHLLAITEEQRASLLASLEDMHNLGEVGEFLAVTLEVMKHRPRNEIADLETGYVVHTMRPAEIAYLEARREKVLAKVDSHQSKGEQLKRDGFEASARYDLDCAANAKAFALSLEAQIKELNDEIT